MLATLRDMCCGNVSYMNNLFRKMVERVRITQFEVPVEERAFVEALLGDIADNAKILKIRRFTFGMQESNLTKKAKAWRVSCEQKLKHYGSYGGYQKQEYDAESDHGGYNGRVSQWASAPKRNLKAFMALNFCSYYARIAEFYPDYTTRYIDCPREI